MTYLIAQKKLSFRIFADDTNMFFTSDNLNHASWVHLEWRIEFSL